MCLKCRWYRRKCGLWAAVTPTLLVFPQLSQDPHISGSETAQSCPLLNSSYLLICSTDFILNPVPYISHRFFDVTKNQDRELNYIFLLLLLCKKVAFLLKCRKSRRHWLVFLLAGFCMILTGTSPSMTWLLTTREHMSVRPLTPQESAELLLSSHI